jgi:RimJ/RimL family protein N-acetyltransferase
MKDPKMEVVTKGKYLDRYEGRYLFLFKDIRSGKVILAGSKDKGLSAESDIPGYEKVFDDIDYILFQNSDFKKYKSDHRIKKLDQREVESFCLEISEDDKETLDITFENEVIYGTYFQSTLVGISRYTPLTDEPQLIDITIVIHPLHRGRGFGIGLASLVIDEILKSGRFPRYRVRQTLEASRSIAERLGLRPAFQLTTFEKI